MRSSRSVSEMLPDIYSEPTNEELDEQEALYERMRRAVNEVQDEEQALRESPGGVD